jgi:hypothetical protein
MEGTNLGSVDAFLTKLDATGTILWTRQWGGDADDKAGGVAVDREGSVYVAGTTSGSADGQTSAGSDDLFVTKWTNDGMKPLDPSMGYSTVGYSRRHRACGRQFAGRHRSRPTAPRSMVTFTSAQWGCFSPRSSTRTALACGRLSGARRPRTKPVPSRARADGNNYVTGIEHRR